MPWKAVASALFLALVFMLAECEADDGNDRLPEPEDISGGPPVLHGADIDARLEWAPRCPAWLEDYAAFHKESRHSKLYENTTRMMLFICAPYMSGCRVGLGDRIRGLMETLKLAVVTNRTYFIRWEDHIPLQSMLVPADIDWHVDARVEGALGAAGQTTIYSWNFPHTPPTDLTDGTIVNETAQLIAMSHAFVDTRNAWPGPGLGSVSDAPSIRRSCLFRALFKPSEQLMQFVNQTKQELFGSTSIPYVAVHLRMGNFAGEEKVINRFGNTSQFAVAVHAMKAAKELAENYDITAPVLIVTDNEQLRKHLMAGNLPGFVTPPYLATHLFVKGKEEQQQAMLTSFADITLLAHSTCFIASSSGFSAIALWWGQHTCYLKISGNGQVTSKHISRDNQIQW